MSFAQEIRDFTGAFTAVSNALGTRSSREGERLDNEYRKATIDWTRAKTGEIMGPRIELGGWLDDKLGGMKPFDTAVDDTDIATTPTGKPSTAIVLTGAGMGTVGTGKKPPKSTLAKTAAVDDSDVVEASSGSDTALGGHGGDTLARNYKVGIIDRTSMEGLQPRALKIADTMGITARQMGVELVATAGAGGGHRSHGSGTETDWIGYKVDANGNRIRQWNPAERARIAASAGSAGANRFGLYPGGSLHVGYGNGGGRPSAVWGANGILTGPSARKFSNSADRAFLTAFQSGKLYGSSGDDLLIGSDDGFPAYRGGGTIGAAREAIASIESRGSGDYSARNPGGALGRYQIMPANLPSWSRAALGRTVSADEFMANPKIQDQIFDHRFGLLVSKYGNMEDAASAWFTGRPLAGGGAGASDGNITGREYVNRFTAALGAGGGGVGSDTLAGGIRAPGSTGGDELIAPYPESRTKDDAVEPPAPEANPMASSTGDTTLKSTYGDRDVVHEVQPGDTLWDLSKRYNLESYLKIVKANPQIANPDLIHPGDQVVIPGGQQEAPGVPTPRPRPGAVDAAPPNTVSDLSFDPTAKDDFSPGPIDRLGAVDEANPMASSTGDSMLPAEANPMTSSTGDTMPAEPTNDPISQESTADLQAELERAEKQIVLTKATAMDEDTKNRLLNAIAVKIEAAQQELARREGTESYTPYENVTGEFPGRPGVPGAPPRAEIDVQPRPRPSPASLLEGVPTGVGVNDAAFEAGRQTGDVGQAFVGKARQIMDPGYPTGAGGARPDPTRRPVDRSKLYGKGGGGVGDDVVSAAEGSDTLMGGGGKDTMSPAETAIREVTDSWDMTPTGHVMRPDGRESPDDTFTLGRKGAMAGRNWMANLLFGEGVDDTDIAEDAAPDDDTPDASDPYLTGKYSFNQSQISQVEDAVRGWAEREGVNLTESELQMRSLGLLYGFYQMRDPTKAEAVAGSWMQYRQMRYNQWSAIAKAAAGEGDTEKAVEAAVQAYAEIPDGRDFEVEGDATTGYKVRYTDETTGKVITEKVLNPDEMIGMIMNMSPGDVDKFLVKAATDEELPEASPQLTKLLADLDAVPPDQRPPYDAAGTAELDGDEQQIYNNAHTDKVRIWTDTTGGQAGLLQQQDVEKVLSGGAAATAPAAAPAAPAAPAESKTGALEIGEGSDTLAGGTDTPESKEKEVAPGIFGPGDDGTHGLGPPPRRNLPMWGSLKTQFGLTLAGMAFEDATEAYNQELSSRNTKWNNWRLDGGPKEEPKPEGWGAPETMEGGWLGDAPGGQMWNDDTSLVKMQRDYPYLTPAIAPLLPPGPKDNNYGKGNKPYLDPAAKRGQTADNKEYLTDTQKIAQEKWDADVTAAKQEFTDALNAITPVPRKDDEDLRKISDTVTEYDTAKRGAMSEEEVKQFDTYHGLIVDASRQIAMVNGLENASAVEKVVSLIQADPAQPSLPNWRAHPHPTNPGIVLVQPYNSRGPKGPMLHIPATIFEPIANAWRDQSEQYAARAGMPPEPRVPGVVERVVGAVTDEGGALSGPPNFYDAGAAIRETITGAGDDLGDWLGHIVRGEPTTRTYSKDDPNRAVPR